jgi:hypothetical protein
MMFKKGDTVKLKYSVEKTMEMGLDTDVEDYLEDGMSFVLKNVDGDDENQLLLITLPLYGFLWFYARAFMLDGKKSGFVMNVEEF